MARGGWRRTRCGMMHLKGVWSSSFNGTKAALLCLESSKGLQEDGVVPGRQIACDPADSR